jgi:hypothetical protein
VEEVVGERAVVFFPHDAQPISLVGIQISNGDKHRGRQVGPEASTLITGPAASSGVRVARAAPRGSGKKLKRGFLVARARDAASSGPRGTWVHV